MPGGEHRCAALGLMATLGMGLLALAASETQAQKRQKAPPVAKEAPHTQMQEVKREQQPGAKEAVQADVSARNVAVTSSFNGIEIVIFGAVDNSQQPSAESGFYNVLIVVEGVPGRIVVRRKNNVAGLWLNTSSASFDNVPSYYAIASTRPIDEITTEDFRASHGVGFQSLRIAPAFGQTQPAPGSRLGLPDRIGPPARRYPRSSGRGRSIFDRSCARRCPRPPAGLRRFIRRPQADPSPFPSRSRRPTRYRRCRRDRLRTASTR